MKEASHLEDRKELWEAVQNKTLMERGVCVAGEVGPESSTCKELIVEKSPFFRGLWVCQVDDLIDADQVSPDWLGKDHIPGAAGTVIMLDIKSQFCDVGLSAALGLIVFFCFDSHLTGRCD